MFVCTPASTNPDVLRDAAAKGIRAAFLASAGYGEAGDGGRRAQDELVALADELGVLIVGPNGQGVISTPSSLCAQIVAPYPPAGRIGVASQSGNFVSSFLNYACASGVGISRAVSAGNSAMVGVTDFLGFYADDPHTDVALALRRRHHRRPARSSTSCGRSRERMPVVLVKGGATAGRCAGRGQPHRIAGDRRSRLRRHVPPGRRHPRRDDRGGLRAGGHVRHPARAAGQPTSRSCTTAGGWGVVTADAIAPTAPRAGRAARRPGRRARRGAAAALEPQQPDRPGRRRDEGHDHRPSSRSSPAIPRSTRSCCSAWASSRNQGRMEREGPVLPGPRARSHRRLPRPPGPPVHRRPPPRSSPSWTSRCSSPPSWR